MRSSVHPGEELSDNIAPKVSAPCNLLLHPVSDGVLDGVSSWCPQSVVE